MAKITKVKSAYLERLNNAEYRTFMARYGNLLAGHEGSVLGVVQFRDVNVFYFCNLFHFLVDLDP